MNPFSVDFILFSVGNYQVSLLELLSTIFGLTCVFLAGRGKTINYWFGYIYSILLFLLFFQKHLYSSTILQPVSLTIAIYGHYRWSHPHKEEENRKKELKIRTLDKKEALVSIIFVAIFCLLWGLLVQAIGHNWPDLFPPAVHPYLDAFVMGSMLAAQYLSARKVLECWGYWGIVNITNIILYLYSGMIFMPIVCSVYLVLAVMGFISWKKEWKTQDYHDAVN